MKSLGKAAKVSKAELALNKREQAWDHKVSVSNARFESAEPAVKRVIIAQDVLKWMAGGKLHPKSGSYLNSYIWDESQDGYKVDDRTGNIIDTKVEDYRVNGAQCSACAIGAVFACAVERVGLHTPRGLARGIWSIASFLMCEELAPFFSEATLRSMETAFEQTGSKLASVDTASERMTLIMENIIANKGEFVYDQLPA